MRHTVLLIVGTWTAWCAIGASPGAQAGIFDDVVGAQTQVFSNVARATTDLARERAAEASKQARVPPKPNSSTLLDQEIAKINEDQNASVVKRAQQVLQQAAPEKKRAVAAALEDQAKELSAAQNNPKSITRPETRSYIAESIATSKAAAKSFRSNNDALPNLDPRTAETIVSSTRLSFLICSERVSDENRIVYWQDDINAYVRQHSSTFDTVGRLESFDVVLNPEGKAVVNGQSKPFGTAFSLADIR